MDTRQQKNRYVSSDEWYTPQWMIERLGPFELDPCSPAKRPFDTAMQHFTKADNGLRILYLPVKKEWFEMERSGVKPEEYRAITPYWAKRIMKNYPISWRILMDIAIEKKDFSCFYGKTFGGFTHVELSMGYPKKGDASRRVLFEIKEIVIGKGKSEWGAPAEDVFIIRLGNKTEQL